LKFNEDMSQYVPKEQLWTEFGGDLDFNYDHSVYWPALAKLCEERRAQRKRRWEVGGKQIGETEDYLTGLAPEGVAPPSAAQSIAPAPETDVEKLAEKLEATKVSHPEEKVDEVGAANVASVEGVEAKEVVEAKEGAEAKEGVEAKA
jgi:hypothetical protein